MNDDIKTIIDTVQHNCHIADARHAGDYTLCVYLLKMREMYRWEQKQSFNVSLTTDDVGDWLTEREGLWDDIEEQDYKPLLIDGVEYDPFDNEAINVLMHDKGLVYNAGLGIRCRPHFFLAELEKSEQDKHHSIIIAGKEYARDMAAPPAMVQQDRIYIRRESLRRMLWEKVEEWRMSGLDNPIGRAAAYYDFDNDVEASLDKMADVETSMIIAHEKGEAIAGRELGDGWLDMLAAMPQTHAEIMLRAIRDHYADAITTLPLLIKNNREASIHFYFGTMTAMRKKLAPALITAYQSWHESGELTELEQLLPTLQAHWKDTTTEALAIYTSRVDTTDDIHTISNEIEKMIDSRVLS